MNRRAIVCGLALLAAGCMTAAASPDQIDGLVAWYKADELQQNLGRDKPVSTWPDISGNGHDLTEDQKGLPALFTPAQANNLPAVRMQKGTRFTVAKPFELGDCTIFVVYRRDSDGRAFIRSDTDMFLGIILGADGKWDQLQTSAPVATINFGSATQGLREYGITVLARQSDFLMSFLNGADISAGAEYSGVLAVGKLFRLDHNQYAKSDGEGLRIAEMIFYNRYLTDAERVSVTDYLAAKYAIEVTKPELVAETAQQARAGGPAIIYEGTSLAQLSTNSKANINEGVAVVSWDLQDGIDAPFEHDTGAGNSKLKCTNDGTRARLYVSLPVSTTAADVDIRVLFRVNGSAYMRGEGRSGIFGRAGATDNRTVYSEVVTTLNAGDYVEVVVLREGAEGEVTITPSAAVFTAEVK
jgi:hypothetical protein